MKQIKAGSGTCGFLVFTGDSWMAGCEMSKQEALAVFNIYEPGQRHWCCDSGWKYCK